MKNRIVHLDAMRGIAILLVLLFHTYGRWPGHLSFVNESSDILVVKYGYLGVNLFFVISGYVILMTLDKKNSLIEFYISRWLRLFPLMFLCSLLIYSSSFFLDRPAGSPELLDLVPGLIFVNAKLISLVTNLDIKNLEGAFWSIYIEVIFYILSGLIYFTVRRANFSLCIGLLYVVYWFIEFGFGNTFYYKYWQTVSGGLGLKYYYLFYVGSFFYDYSKRRVLTYEWIFCLLVSIIYMSSFEFGMELIANAIVVAFFVATFHFERLKILISNRVMVFMGFISYPFYLIHENMIVSLSKILISISYLSSFNVYILPLMPISLIVLLSWLLAKYIEKPFRNQLIKILNIRINIFRVN